MLYPLPRHLIQLTSALVVFAHFAMGQGSAVFPAHSHNDYVHDRPLREALEKHFRSVEADVFCMGDSLYVAHDASDIKLGRTLRSLYLEPLREIVSRNDGMVYESGIPLILLVDIKDDGVTTYQCLHRVLTGYKYMLTRFIDGDVRHGPVTVIVSGNRPLEYIRKQNQRYAGYDGRISDLSENLPAFLMPMVSDNWDRHFSWKGNGRMPIDQWAKLRGIVQKAHSMGCIVRFWSTPDSPVETRESVWRVLHEAGVDLIGTDDLAGLEAWFRNVAER